MGVVKMPKSLEEIMAQADEMAARFENYEPQTVDEAHLGQPLVVLRSAVVARVEAESAIVDAVRWARKDHLSWAAIGAVLGTSGEAARQRYAKVVEPRFGDG